MDVLVTRDKNENTKVFLITEKTPYGEIKDEICTSESYSFVFGRESRDVSSNVIDTERKFKSLMEMIKEMHVENKLSDEQKKIVYDFKDQFESFIKMF